jgi:hypothetical protein
VRTRTLRAFTARSLASVDWRSDSPCSFVRRVTTGNDRGEENGGCHGGLDTALAASRDAVDQMIRGGEQSGAAWTAHRRPTCGGRSRQVDRPALTEDACNHSQESINHQSARRRVDGPPVTLHVDDHPAAPRAFIQSAPELSDVRAAVVRPLACGVRVVNDDALTASGRFASRLTGAQCRTSRLRC